MIKIKNTYFGIRYPYTTLSTEELLSIPVKTCNCIIDVSDDTIYSDIWAINVIISNRMNVNVYVRNIQIKHYLSKK